MSDEYIQYWCEDCGEYVDTGTSGISGQERNSTFCLKCDLILFEWRYKS